MATGGASLKLKRLRQRFGINAPRLAVRTHFPWYLRALAVVAMLSAMLILAAWIFEAGKRTATFQGNASVRENGLLRARVSQLESELARLRDSKGSGESNLQIERATHQELTLQIKALEEQNAALKHDLAFFENLMSASNTSADAGIRIERMRVDPEATSGQYRYRMLLVNSGGQRAKEFKGTLEIVLQVRQADKDVMIRLPSRVERNAGNFNLEIKHYQRIEGLFSVPPGATLKSVEARVLRDGQVRARQSLAL
ncbi:MAG: hypothetical protein IAE88_01750 [Rhodobacteraceae bacterium]|nr:hypothetical protein [Paracoccaceae bacterium]